MHDVFFQCHVDLRLGVTRDVTRTSRVHDVADNQKCENHGMQRSAYTHVVWPGVQRFQTDYRSFVLLFSSVLNLEDFKMIFQAVGRVLGALCIKYENKNGQLAAVVHVEASRLKNCLNSSASDVNFQGFIYDLA